MEDRFDEAAKALAQGLTRRDTLRRTGAGIAGLLLASLGFGKARAQAPGTCPAYCRSLGLTPGGGNAFGKCVSNCAKCRSSLGTPCGASSCCYGDEICCPEGTPGATCVSCPDGTELDPETCECVPTCCADGPFICGVTPAVDKICGVGGEFGVCLCFSRLDGTAECGADAFCDSLVQNCTSDEDCPDGTYCSPDTCCVVNVCIAYCECSDLVPTNVEGFNNPRASGFLVES